MPFIHERKVYFCSCGVALQFTIESKSNQLCLWHSFGFQDGENACPNDGKYFDIPHIELQERV